MLFRAVAFISYCSVQSYVLRYSSALCSSVHKTKIKSNFMGCSAVLCSAVICSENKSAVTEARNQISIRHFPPVLCSTLLDYSMYYIIVEYCVFQDGSVLSSTVHNSNLIYCTVQYNTMLQCIFLEVALGQEGRWPNLAASALTRAEHK